MADAATAVLALWNDVADDLDTEYNDWHANEHVPERLTVPGMLWGLRYRQIAAPMPRYLTLYGLRDPSVLDSVAYQRLLSHPTPMSQRMRPALRNITRWVCAVQELEPFEACETLRVVTIDTRSQEGQTQRAAVLSSPHVGRLLAVRIEQAAPLPWLGKGQSQQVEGNTLICLGIPQELGAPDVGAARVPDSYRRIH